MNPTTSKVVLVTGASSGIGEAIARQLAASGHRVVMGARRTDRLQTVSEQLQAQGLQAAFQALDVTDLQDMQRFVAFAESTFGPVDVIINNAGAMPLSPLAALKVDEWNRMIDVNIRGVLHGIAAALPGMQQRGHGQVINLSSIGGHMVFPAGAVYCATKFAVCAISEGLRQETNQIRVTVISPGVVESELADTITHEGSRAAVQEFRRVALQPADIARAVAYAIDQPDGVDVSEVIVRPTAGA